MTFPVTRTRVRVGESAERDASHRFVGGATIRYRVKRPSGTFLSRDSVSLDASLCMKLGNATWGG